MRLINKLGLMVAVIVAATFMATRAEAAAFTIDFCPEDATCPAGVTEASLTFEEIIDADPNNYTVTATIVGDLTSPAFIDELSFTISGVATPAGYEALPTLSATPGGGNPWTVFFDDVNGGTGCGTDPLSSQEVCAQSTDLGESTDGTNTWVFLVDLADSEGVVGAGTTVNLRAQFVNADGSNAGILSPGGGELEDDDDVTPDDNPADVITPEPASMLLFGLGLSAAAFGARRRDKKS